MSAAVGAALRLAEDPEVAEAVAEAREACTRLRWHPALRRRIPEAAAESRVRGAAASGELEGARLSEAIVRDLMRGATTWHEPLDPVEAVMKGAVAATAETELLAGLVVRSPVQALARLHTLAAADLLPPDQLGRPRQAGEDCRELTEVGAAPGGADARERLRGVADLIGAMDVVPVPVVVGLVHAEILHARPFVRANGVVARAMERVLVRAGGLDPTGVAVTELGHGGSGGPAYLGALTAYARGDRRGVVLWLVHEASSLTRAAQAGEGVADAVLAGRLS
ncbi:MAG: hypothetical protein IPM00_18895 [Tetrasphaera sp.]|nr:hypothetical protein [Tetrasphaera sp.]